MALLDRYSPEDLHRLLELATDDEAEVILDALQAELGEENAAYFPSARPNQRPPAGDWLIWLLLAGRGFGKSRTGAEWLAEQMIENPGTRWAIVAATFGDARDTCVEGESGLQSVLDRRGVAYTWNRSMGELLLDNGSRVKLFSSEKPKRLRGPQFHGAWCDELCAWENLKATWDMLQFGLRLGERPRVVITTTPRPLTLLKTIKARATTHLTTGSTYDNVEHLSAVYHEIIATYEGTTLGRQELHAEIIEDVDGALWHRAMIEDDRVFEEPTDADGFLALRRIVVAVDPTVSDSEDSDETGIIVAGIDSQTPPHAYVLYDGSKRCSVNAWARRAIAAYRDWSADRVVGEANNGGDLVELNLRTVDPNVPYRKVTASRGKKRRAEPVVGLYEQHRVHHVGNFPELEDQMCQWIEEVDWSPDRMDALVWALTDLLVDGPRTIEGSLMR